MCQKRLIIYPKRRTDLALLCYVCTQEARTQFARVKHVKQAASQSREMLCTLIPPNVLARLASHSHDKGILATDITQV